LEAVTIFFYALSQTRCKANRVNRRAMKTLIVDDEPIARRVLREQLDMFSEIEVIGEAENGRDALQQIR